MEDTHGVRQYETDDKVKGLNPYYNGRYSWRERRIFTEKFCTNVLILIIMEDTHGGSQCSSNLCEIHVRS